MTSLSSMLGSGIKSIQRGTTTLAGANANATVTAVVTAKTELRFLGGPSGSGVQLANTTTVTALYGGINGTVSWELTEFF